MICQFQGFWQTAAPPESITEALPELVASGARHVGGYANTFTPVPANWTLDGSEPTDGLISLRDDLDPAAYVAFASEWQALGATVIGGCCGTRPAHISGLRYKIG